jgi:hypothetical protein
MLTNPMVTGPTKAPAPPRMAAMTPRIQPTAMPKAPTQPMPKGGLAPPMKAALARPKVPQVPKPSPANQGPQTGTGAMNRSNRAFGKQQRKIRNALNSQAGNQQNRGGLPTQPIAGAAAGGMPQAPGASSQAADVDAQY